MDVSHQSYSQLLDAYRFRYVADTITEANFPVGQLADVKCMSVLTQQLGGVDMSTAEIEEAVKRKGLRSATLAELLVYAREKWNKELDLFRDGPECRDWGNGTGFLVIQDNS